MVKTLGLEFNTDNNSPDAPVRAGDSSLEPGTRVKHEVLGEGTIVSYNEARGSYTVQFGNGTRNIRRNFLKPL